MHELSISGRVFLMSRIYLFIYFNFNSVAHTFVLNPVRFNYYSIQ